MNSTGQKTILIADDEAHMRRLLQFSLRKTGAKIIEAATGAAALQLAQTEPVDLFLIDYVMPDMDGFAVVRALRNNEKFRHAPVVLLTSRGQSELRDTAEGLGIDLFLTKPFSPAELTQQVLHLLEPSR